MRFFNLIIVLSYFFHVNFHRSVVMILLNPCKHDYRLFIPFRYHGFKFLCPAGEILVMIIIIGLAKEADVF